MLTSSSCGSIFRARRSSVSRRRSSPTSPRPPLRPRRSCAWANPVLWSVIVSAACCSQPDAVSDYFAERNSSMSCSARVVGWLALWHGVVKSQARRRVDLAALVGGATAAGSAVLLAWLFAMPPEVVRSLAAKSVTAPVAMACERIAACPRSRPCSRSRPPGRRALGKYLFNGWASRAGRCAASRSARRRMARRRAGVASARRRRRLRGIALGCRCCWRRC